MAWRFASVTASLLLLVTGTLASRQSPIDIVEEDVVSIVLPDLVYENYESSRFRIFTVENTGHSAQISMDNSLNIPTVTGGPLGEDEYKLQQIHFHWGKNESVGSEHELNGKYTSMEVHLVHYNSNYSSFAEACASDDEDSLAVVGIFIESAHSKVSYNEDFQLIVETLTDIVEPNEKVSSTSNLLGWLVPYLEPDGYYTYEGSLTTKPYSENVIWIVYEDPVLIRWSQIDAFRNLRSHKHKHLRKNFRNVQDRGDRMIVHVPDSDD